MKFVYCDKCGYYKGVKTISFEKCPFCNTPLIIDDSKADEDLANYIIGNLDKTTEIKQAKDGLVFMLELFGDKETWKKIELKKDAITRLAFRKMFFEVGGKI